MNKKYQVDLSGKVAVVTGAGGTLCSEMARALAYSGAKVAVLGRTMSNIQAVADEINAAGYFARPYKADVTDREVMDAVAAQIAEEIGPCDILVNGAGGNNAVAITDKEYYEPGDIDADTRSFFDLDPSGVRSVLDVNFMGTFIPCQAFAKYMLDKGGSIINISSAASELSMTKVVAYAAAKSGINNFTRWLAIHFSKVGIRVNSITPGVFSAKQNAKLLWNEDGTPTPRTSKILAATPVERLGEASELTGALLYLACDEASGFVTGSTVCVDGGYTIYIGV